MQCTIQTISSEICREGEASWKWSLFEFVDGFRREPSDALIASPPVPETSVRVRALIASTVEALCDEQDMAPPPWRLQAPVLSSPWFVSGIENLKATALVESPAHFRKRNIFVLGNFLDRA